MIKIFLYSLFVFVFINNLSAQRRQNVTINVLGTTPLLGVKYDTRILKEQNNGFGLTAGVGSIELLDDGGDYEASLSFGTNYLFGNGRHQLLIGANIAFVFSRFYPLDSKPKNITRTMFIPDIGYRFSPTKKGFTGQLTWNPLKSNLDRESAYQYFGIGLGYSWK